MAVVITLWAESQDWAILLLQDLVSHNKEGCYKAAAEEHQHHAKQTPLIVHRKWKVLWKEKCSDEVKLQEI